MSKPNDLLEGILEVPVSEMKGSEPFARFSDWSSLKHVQLVVGIQSAFDVEREEIQRLETVEDIRSLLAERGVSP